MAVPSGEAFTRQFRGLSTADRAAFIVDLLAARGWTAEHGETIVATRDGITRRFAVGAPASGRAVDVIVLTTEGTRADRIARAYDATVIGPPTIYSWLRYGIDRGAAIALSRAYLYTDGDIDPTPGPIPARALPARARPSVAWLTRIRSPLAPRDVAGLVVLVSVIGLITIAALTGGAPMGAPDPSPTVTPVEHTRLPAGLSTDGLEDIDIVIATHAERLRHHPSVHLHARFEGPRFLTGFDTRRSGYAATDEAVIDAKIQSQSRYYLIRTTNFSSIHRDDPEQTVETYRDGSMAYRRLVGNGTVRYAQIDPSRTDGALFMGWVQTILRRYLATTESTVEPVHRTGGTHYRVIATGRPTAYPYAVSGYRAVALVSSDGRVTGMTVGFQHPGTGATVRVALDFEFSNQTTLSAPAWYPAAKNATAPGTNVTVTPPG